MMSPFSPPSQFQSTSALRTALQTFISSPSPFRVLTSYSPNGPSVLKSPPFSPPVYILDSSFNPPTQAHLRIVISALLYDQTASSFPKRLLLLLATQNADKASKPASFEQRLAMMNIFAQEIRQKVKEITRNEKTSGENSCDHGIIVDVGVTKRPYFHDKATAIEDSGFYKSPETNTAPEQVYLIGFDTLTRLLDPKYYPPAHTLHPLNDFFEKHRVRVTPRATEAYGGVEQQVLYVSALKDGEREHEGGKKGWADRIRLLEGETAEDETVSSTKVREAVRKGDDALLDKYVVGGVRRFILDHRLYVDEE